VKLYRNIYEEPNLRFYMAGMLASLSQIVTVNGNPETQSGMQIDGTFGTEFHINSIESLGFSMEFVFLQIHLAMTPPLKPLAMVLSKPPCIFIYNPELIPAVFMDLLHSL
jgi:hypothetical protein